jgi:16S rRNA (guanine527-N7)-methyltransferase
LAAWFSETRWTLLDQHRRRTSFLARAVAGLGWTGRVAVVRAPAEDAAHDPDLRESFNVVTSRSFGAPAVTAECASGFLGVGGGLVVAEPPVPAADRWPALPLAALGLRHLPSMPGVAVFEKTAPLDDALPRTWRELQRRPRW